MAADDDSRLSDPAGEVADLLRVAARRLAQMDDRAPQFRELSRRFVALSSAVKRDSPSARRRLQALVADLERSIES